MCNIVQNNNLSQNKDTLTIDKSFKMSKLEYHNNFIADSNISAYKITLTTTDNGVSMLSHCMKNFKASCFNINPLHEEYYGIKDYIYSPAICMKYYSNDFNIMWVFIITLDGEGHLFTNDSFYGYHMMVDFIFGGETNFKYSCQIKSAEVTSNEVELRPFVNMLDEFMIEQL